MRMTPQQRHAYERQQQWERMSNHQQSRMERAWQMDTAKLAVTVAAVLLVGMVLSVFLAKGV